MDREMTLPPLFAHGREITRDEVIRSTLLRMESFPDTSAPLLLPVNRTLSDVTTVLAGIFLGRTVCPIPAEATSIEREAYLAAVPGSRMFLAGEAGTSGRRSSLSPMLWENFSCVLFTSGTSGTPKPVALRGKEWIASCEAFASYHRIQAGDTWLLSIPLYYAGGFAILMRALFTGHRLAIPEDVSVEALRRWMEGGELSGMSVVPTVLKRILDAGPLNPAGLKKVLVGGAPVSEFLLDRAIKSGIPAECAYGATETCAQIAGERVFPGVMVREEEDGELVICGPMVAGGEWRSGDVGGFDPEGRLRISGRKKDLINSGGVKIAPAEVEAALLGVPGVEDCAVWGEENDDWGETVTAMVVAPTLDTASIAAHLRGRLSSPKVPKRIIFASEIPRNRAGKFDRLKVGRE